MDHIATCKEFGFGHRQGNAEGVFYEAHDEGCLDYVPADDKECADDPVISLKRERGKTTYYN